MFCRIWKIAGRSYPRSWHEAYPADGLIVQGKILCTSRGENIPWHVMVAVTKHMLGKGKHPIRCRKTLGNAHGDQRIGEVG